MEGEVSIEIIPVKSAIFWNYIKNSILKLLDNSCIPLKVNAVSNSTHLVVSKGNGGGQLEIQV